MKTSLITLLLRNRCLPLLDVGVLVNPDDTILAAGGFIFQLMPGIEDETITKVEERLKTISPISKLLKQGLTPEEILEELFGKEHVNVLETMPVQFKCVCSKESLCRCNCRFRTRGN